LIPLAACGPFCSATQLLEPDRRVDVIAKYRAFRSRHPRREGTPRLADRRQLGGLASGDEIDLAVEDLEQREDLIDRFPIVRLIEQSIQLCSRCSKSSHDPSISESLGGGHTENARN
jgi:hypothetical protein